MSEIRALAKEHGMRGYSRLRIDGLIGFLWDSIRMETNYNAFRLVELRAFGLEYYRLKKTALIALIRSTPSAVMSQCLRNQLVSTTDPGLQSLQHLLPHLLKVHLFHMHWSELSGEPIEVFELMEEAGWMWKPSLGKSEGV